MATIQSTLEFQDKMSATLNKIVQALENAAAKSTMAQTSLGMLETEQSQWKQTLDAANNSINKNSEAIKQSQEKYDEVTRSIETTKTELEKYKQTIDQNQAKIDKIAEMQEEFNKKLNETKQAADNAGTGLSSMQGKIITLASAFQLFGQIKGFIQSVNSKINEFVAYTQTQMQAEDQLSIITKQRMALNDDEVRSLYALASAQQRIGVVGDEATIAAMSGIAAFTTQKNSIQALTPAMDNLAVKMYGYNVTAENMDMISKSLGKAMLGDVGALSRMGVKIDDVTKKRLMSLREEERAIELARIIKSVTGDMNEEMAKTPFGQIAQANNRLSDSYEKLGAMLLPIQAAFTTIWSNIVDVLVKNSNVILVVIGAITIALGIWQAQAIATAVANLAAFFPIIAVITAIVGAIGLVIAVLNVFGIDANKACGDVLGAFAVLGAFIWNTFLSLLNLVLSLINTQINLWISYARFLKNVFRDPIGAIKQLFTDMAHHVLGILGSIAKGIDNIFGSNFSKTVNNWESKLPKAGRGLDLSTDKMGLNRIAYKDAFKISNKVNTRNLLGNSKTGAGGGGGLGGGNGLAGLTTNTSGGKALKTQNQGKIEMQEDDIELLHDLATRDFMLNYQQLTPQITIPGMVIHETADVDSIFEAFADNVTEVVNSSMQLVDGRAA